MCCRLLEVDETANQDRFWRKTRHYGVKNAPSTHMNSDLHNPKNGPLTENTTTATMISQVGVIGLGRMGHVFANLLIAGGIHLVAYDRDPRRVQMVANEGATPACYR
jgi:phosphoglycerate dehydrogenase-like enzyme